MTLTLFALPLLAIFFGLPVFVALLLAVLATLAFFLNVPTTMVHQTLFGNMSNYTLLAIPFFVFAGEVMGKGGISHRIVQWVLALVGRAPGAVGLVTVGTSSIYGAISGSSPATVASVGSQMYPEMIKSGYSKRFSVGLLNAGGAISIVIPPSINLILFGAVAEQPIAKLFTAGLLPGLLMSAVLALAVVIYAKRNDLREGAQFSWSHLLETTKHAFWALLTPVIVLGAIYGGIVSPTEAGGIACVYSIVVAVLLYKDLSWAELFRIAGSSVLLTAQIMIIVAAAGVFAWVLTVSGIQGQLTNFVMSADVPPWAVLMLLNLLLLMVGCFIDPASAVLTLAPILLPIATGLGVDPIHFGVMMTVNLSIGMYTPPFGLNLFVSQAVLGVSSADVYKGVLPFVAIQIVALLIITYVPAISLALL